MATWRDGPEYAPRARPGQFAAPQVGPLQQRPIADSPGSPGVPAVDRLPHGRPGYLSGPPAPPLYALGFGAVETRDPHRSFTPTSSALTAFDDGPQRVVTAEEPKEAEVPGFDPRQPLGRYAPAPATWPADDAWSALGAADHPDPRQHPGQSAQYPSTQDQSTQYHDQSTQHDASPSAQRDPGYADPASAPFPAPGTPEWFGPGLAPPPRAAAPSPKALLSAITPAVVILLVLGGVVLPLSLPLYITAMFASTRIRLVRGSVRNVFLSGLGATLVLSLVRLMVSSDDFGSWWNAMSMLSMLVSWATLLVLGLVVGRAVQTAETRRPPAA